MSLPEPRRRLDWLGVLHVVLGVVGLFVFAETGQFMDQRLDHLVGMADGPRALYRSSHIYILLCALLHFALGLYLNRSSWLPGRVLQILGSLLLVASFAGFVYGFYVETPLAEVERPMIRNSIYASLAGVLVHGLERFVALLRTPRTERGDDGGYSRSEAPEEGPSVADRG